MNSFSHGSEVSPPSRSLHQNVTLQEKRIYILMRVWSKLSEDGDKAETCMSEIIQRSWNCAYVGVVRVTI
jgi:hypothetical protein